MRAQASVANRPGGAGLPLADPKRTVDMAQATHAAGRYEAPRIESRTDIAQTLIGAVTSANIDVPESAAFRAV